ncbi:hypothetical protein F4810DRAFT_655347 [Camillea tinctor]|nr:hypothetical protein F4810DRAFT_655347 [Camillea tinctor]
MYILSIMNITLHVLCLCLSLPYLTYWVLTLNILEPGYKFRKAFIHSLARSLSRLPQVSLLSVRTMHVNFPSRLMLWKPSYKITGDNMISTGYVLRSTGKIEFQYFPYNGNQ